MERQIRLHLEKGHGILFCLLMLISCSNTTNNDDFYLSQLKKERIVLQKAKDFIIHSNNDSTANTIGKLRFTFATNRTGDLHAFYDELKKQFVITDNEGVIKQIISKKGKGPSEIVKAGGFNFDGRNQLVVYDQNQIMIKVFNLQGDIIHNSKLEPTNFPLAGRKIFVNNNKIYSSTMDRKLLGNLREEAYKSKLAAVYDYNGNFIDTLGTYDNSVREAKSYNLFSIVNVDFENNLLLSSHFHNYRIQVYNIENEQKLARFARKTKNFKVGAEYISPNLPRKEIKDKSAGRSSAVSLHPTSNYIVLYFETLTESFFNTKNFNEKKSYLVVYDKKSYDCYGEIAIPYVVGNVANDKFFLIENDNPENFKVGVYELKKQK